MNVSPKEQGKEHKNENDGDYTIGNSSSPNLDVGQRDNEQDKNFDWNQDDESIEDHVYSPKAGPKTQRFISLIHKSWFQRLMVLFLAIVLMTITIFIHVMDQENSTAVTINLELWFTFITFIYVMAIAMHCLVEIIPGLIKHFVKKTTPTTLEILKMRLAVSKALLLYGVTIWVV